MRIPLGGEQKNEGFYGGVGAKPAQKPWTPAVHEPEAPREQVPKRFGGLKLRRRRSRMEPTPDYVIIPVAVVTIGLVFLLVLLILG